MSNTRNSIENQRFSVTRKDLRMAPRETKSPFSSPIEIKMTKPINSEGFHQLASSVREALEDLVFQLNTALREITRFRDEDGKILPGSFKTNIFPSYEVTNDTTDRTFDANSTSVAELADVLASLLADLDDWGIITRSS